MKSFTATKFREGYDPDEVDDFLDEVIWTIGQLQSENTELKAQLEEAQNKVVAGGGGEVVTQPVGDVDERVAKLEAELEASRQRVSELEAAACAGNGAEQTVPQDNSEADALREELAQANARIHELETNATNQAAADRETVAGMAALNGEDGQVAGEPASATSMLALAQRVHDEYVRDGQQEGARLIEEAKAQGAQIIREAEAKRDEVVQGMEGRRDELQTRIEDLKGFESEYRSNLRSHLEDLLGRVNRDEN